MSIDDADNKFLHYLSDEQNVKDYFNDQIRELVGRMNESDTLAGVYQASGNKQMFEDTLRAKHAMSSELALAELSKLNFLANARHQQQIKESLKAIISDSKKDIQDILDRITNMEQQAKDLHNDKDFINHLKRRYVDKASDVSLE